MSLTSMLLFICPRRLSLISVVSLITLVALVVSCAEDPPPSTAPTAGEMTPPIAGEVMGGGAEPTPMPSTPCQGESCPTGRLVSFNIPPSADEARALGCDLKGEGNGSAFSLLLRLADIQDPSSLLNPDEMGVISLVAFMRLTEWMSAYTANEARGLDLHFLLGEQDADGSLSISSSSYDASGAPLVNIPDSALLAGELTTPSVDVDLNIALFGDALIRVQISQASVGGRAVVNGPSFSLSGGYVQGYLTEAALLNFVADLKSSCASPEPPEVCATLASAIDGEPADILNVLMTILGGYDGITDAEGRVSPCDSSSGQACDTIGLCVQFELE